MLRKIKVNEFRDIVQHFYLAVKIKDVKTFIIK